MLLSTTLTSTRRGTTLLLSRVKNQLPVAHKNLNHPNSNGLLSRHHQYSSTAKVTIQHKKVSPQERAALRQARKQRATKPPSSSSSSQQSQSQAGTGTSSTTLGTASTTTGTKPIDPRLVFGLGVTIPAFLVAWGQYDENSPPAKFAKMLGWDDFAEGFAKPHEDKLLRNWEDMSNVPPEFQPMTLVLDMEDTLVNASWDRKHGWRIAKRPGLDKFIKQLAQYYEIVLYTPSISAVAIPVVEKLQMDTGGAIMHSLFREACYYKNGTYMKDLSKLNRDMNRIILIDDDEKAAELNAENLIKVKPYVDPTDRKDDTLERLLPFLMEVASSNIDVPTLLSQFKGMDADDIADEMDRRISDLRVMESSRGGLSSFARTNLPKPEMTPVKDRNRGTVGLSSKDLVGDAPKGSLSGEGEKGLGGWLQRRQEKQQKQQMEQMEYWNMVMKEKHMEKQKEEQEKSQHA